jgi:glutamate decarboxylase
MVHLGKVPTDDELKKPVIEALKELDLSGPGNDDFTTSVYGSRFAAADLPKHEMPENEMPREVAYRMIKWVTIIW